MMIVSPLRLFPFQLTFSWPINGGGDPKYPVGAHSPGTPKPLKGEQRETPNFTHSWDEVWTWIFHLDQGHRSGRSVNELQKGQKVFS